MRTAGEVIFVSRNGGMIVVHHDDGYAVVELIGNEGSIAVGDRVRGDWDALGGEPLWTEHGQLDAYVQGNWGGREAAIQVARQSGGG